MSRRIWYWKISRGSEAIRRAVTAKKTLSKAPMVGTTIPHEIRSAERKYGLKPAALGLPREVRVA